MKIKVTTRNVVTKCEVMPSTRCPVCGRYPYGSPMWVKSIVGVDNKNHDWCVCHNCAKTPEEAEKIFEKISTRIKINSANAFSKPRD